VIGGKVLDPSALAAQAQGSIAMETWLAVTVPTGLVLYLPELAAAEAQAVYPGNERLGRLLRFPTVFRAGLSRTDALKVARLLTEAKAWDGTAGHVILVARQRGWPVLATDPDRLRRIAPDLDIDLL
jgi:hypothetical protein